jgi:hypothetical protein
LHKLPVYRVVGLAWLHVIRHKLDLLRLALPWFALPAVLAACRSLAGPGARPVYDGIETGLAYLAGLVLARAWIRHVLLDERRTVAPLDLATVRYVGWNVVLVVLAAIPALPAILYALLGPESDISRLARLASVLIAIPFVVRLALAFAPIAIGEERGAIGRAWQAGQGSWWRLIGAFAITTISAYVVFLMISLPIGVVIVAADPTAVLPDHPSLAVIGHLLAMLATALTSGLIAWSWRALTQGEAALPTR